jgi:glycosyltransferase involved in cell wall biosynthesis
MDTHGGDIWGSAGTWPGVTIVLPILNEERHLDEAISAILRQDYPGDFEVILALGPSRDKTNEIAARLSDRDARVRLVENPTGRTAAGLNAAIALSRFPLITRIDGHAEVSRSYVREAVTILRQTGAVNAGGIMAAEGQTLFERAVATAMRSPLGVGSSRFHTGGGAGESDTVYLGNFVKSAIIAAGGYDERYTRAQDWELNFRLRKNGGVIWFDPSLVVTYRPRSTIKALAKQYFEYGRWRHAVARSHKGSVNYRYLAPPTALAINITSVVLGVTLSPLFYLPLLTYSAAVLLGAAVIGKSVREKAILPAILIAMHMSWGAGYLTSPPQLIAEAGEE